ncbi:NAD(P)/FAD-dependent oxidoreductase [Aetokthonos hydrillicola Thurmond2011]|jgi:sulfide:quinone oxidoreductase|uniref:Sulfide-quinone reductase n=1 Tax=Aetokthonos hydrillicola Thurmond2011 TaxID=2712845 RepID=A0AAP5IE89_9CYAN|nr:FAD/NAD(P)-binding oxidoreductase [Aetokthonos hydrillicola]MBO3459619.1 NAD(P)/FAD-dependent oxidoreductase [Aetokthonos hydrillicola CCALA 1050]MBW4588981.1 NAD(P)/FAD-dependent oxidoreductase [Aetokthonos hydrillicola CCALA 1050]MDR9900056.1 NAD(P)/FAD-dependent oxidoreductase [Aetokthonos hydrillicola Thurmond2011]
MAHVVVIGAGLGGLPTAYELRRFLPSQHQVTLISNQPKFTFVPSLPWVGLGLRSLADIQLELDKIVPQHGIDLIHDSVTAINPKSRQISLKDKTVNYDYVVIATGPELALDVLPGLGPEGGYTQSVCNPHHALLACDAWEKLLEEPGPIVVGAAPGASCFGPAYEFALLAHHVLRQKGLRQHVPITFVTSEPYAGHLGIGGMANSRWLIRKFLAQREIELMENTAISHIEPEIMHLADGRTLPFKYAMILPPFRGPRFLREAASLTDPKGFVPVLPTYRHPEFDSIYSVGVVTQLKPIETTPIPIGVPKVGQMTEEMAIAVVHNIALELGVISGVQHKPTLQAICFADFGDTGALFLADPLLPDAQGKRNRAITLSGIWVSWMKRGFEKYFIEKMRLGWTMPWLERWSLQMLGLPLVESVPSTSDLSPMYPLP